MTNEAPEVYSNKRILAAWAVHFYTALGLPLMFFSALELFKNYGADIKDPRMFFILNWIAVLVDASDGFFARKVQVKKVLPIFNGHRLDNLIDFLSFAFLPCCALAAFGLLPTGWEAAAIIPIMASGYGFCQEQAKTDDAFVGFPSYWNILLLYLYIIPSNPWVNLGVTLFLAIMVFVPIHYLYPSRTPFMMRTTLLLGTVWGFAVLALGIYPSAPWSVSVAVASLIFPIYYVVVSLIHHKRVHSPQVVKVQ